MKKQPDCFVSIKSYTDNRGSDDYNLKLSQRRSNSVVDYMISNGIEKSRLQAIGYGKKFPITTNDTEIGRQMNRRSVFEIIWK